MVRFVKLRNYEKKDGIIVSIICLLFFLILFFFHLYVCKFYQYQLFQGVVQKKDMVVFLADQKDLSLFYQNQFIYVNNQKVFFSVENVVENVLQRDHKTYHEVLLKFSFKKNWKEGDVISFSIICRKIRFIEMFKVIWKGDAYGTK